MWDDEFWTGRNGLDYDDDEFYDDLDDDLDDEVEFDDEEGQW